MKTKTTYIEQRSLVPLGGTVMIARLKAEPLTSVESGETLRQLAVPKYKAMRHFYTLLFLFFFTSISFAQYKNDYIWLVGNPTTDTTSNNGINVFDFNGSKLQIKKQQKGLSLFVSNASISNGDGKLLFYTNGCKINNANHGLMQNGSGLNPGFAYLSGNCPDNGDAVTKGILILPLPNDSSKYYVFHLSSEDGFGADIYIGHLYYSLVDMNLANGLGAVVKKNQIILEDTLYTDLHAVKHANGEDWWVLTSKENSKQVFSILFTENGIAQIDTQSIGIPLDPWTNYGGMASFSPDGTKFARYARNDQVTLFDFDRSTGELSNFQQLYADTTEGFWGGLSFSPNSRFLYISTQFKLFQFDLLAPDIQASKVLIDEWDGFTAGGGFSVMFFLMQLAPDCKIYMIPVNGSKYMHVINRPDEPGLACDFGQHSLVLPAINNTSIPNFPNYRLGTGYPVCDSNIVYTASGFTLPPVQGVNLYPNPASGELNLEFSTGTGKPIVFRLYDTTGRLASYWTLEGDGQPQSLNISGLASGLYLWQLNTVDGLPLDKGKLVIEK